MSFFVALSMSLSSVLVSDILAKISDLRGEASTDSSASRIRAVSDAERDFADRMLRKIHRRTDQTITSTGTSEEEIGTTSYPMREKGLSELFVGGTTEDKRYEIVDYNVFKRRVNDNGGDRLVFERYDPAQDKWYAHISPTPTTGDVITYTYFFMPPIRTLGTERVLCPSKTLIARLALSDIYEGEDEAQKSIIEKQQAEQLINEQNGLEVMPAQNQTITFGRPASSKRIGAY